MTEQEVDPEEELRKRIKNAVAAVVASLGPQAEDPKTGKINPSDYQSIVDTFYNQLKTNIPSGPTARVEALTTPYTVPGGKAMIYAYSLRIWLTRPKAKASFVTDDKGYRIGNTVKVKLEKSRFGSQGRQCKFQILWGDQVGVADEESWFDAIQGSEHLERSGAWYELKFEDGTSEKFQSARWIDKLQDDKFKALVLEIMDEEVVLKFDKRTGDATEFYDETA